MKRTEQNRGAAMVIVLCVMVVFLALSTTIVLAGSVALNTARTDAGRELGKAQAVSLSEVFVRDLTDDKTITESSPSLKRYVRDKIVGGWVPYDESESKEKNEDAGAVKYFTMDTEAGGTAETHQIRIEMYWVCEGAAGAPVSEEELGSKEVRLFVDVISTLNDAEYHVKREFQLTALEKLSDDPAAIYPYRWTWTALGRNKDRE